MRGLEVGRRAGMPTAMITLAIASLIGLTAGCTSDVSGSPKGVDIGPLTTAEGTAQAEVDLAEAAVVHYTGTLVAADGGELTADVLATMSGEVSGTITLDALPASVLYVGNTLYLNAPVNFWNGMVTRFGVTTGDGSALANRWVKLPTSLIGVEFGEVFTPDVVAQALGKVDEKAANRPLSRNAKESIAGADAYEVQTRGGTAYFATEQPYGMQRVELDRLGGGENTAVSDVVLDIEDGSPDVVAFYQSLAKTAGGLDSAVDALTGVQQGAHRFEKCASPGCTLIVDIKNTAKTAVRVSLRADWTGDGGKLGSCQSTSAPVAPGAAGKLSCRLTSAQWKTFYKRANSVPGEHPYGAKWSALVLSDAPDVTDLEDWAAAQPAAADGNKTEGSHAVYQIDAGDTVWKYGVVPSRYWREHADDQLRQCTGSTRSACSVSLVTIADNPVSAHALAAKLVGDFAAKHDSCPAGQWVSCQR